MSYSLVLPTTIEGSGWRYKRPTPIIPDLSIHSINLRFDLNLESRFKRLNRVKSFTLWGVSRSVYPFQPHNVRESHRPTVRHDRHVKILDRTRLNPTELLNRWVSDTPGARRVCIGYKGTRYEQRTRSSETFVLFVVVNVIFVPLPLTYLFVPRIWGLVDPWSQTRKCRVWTV